MNSRNVIEIDVNSAPTYIQERWGLDASSIRVTQLAGGVSNTVLLIEHPRGRCVLKQSLPKLRVQQDWASDRERIHREASALKHLQPHLPAGSIPEVLLFDPDNYAYAMTAAPAGAETWKTELLGGEVRPEVAEKIGTILGRMIRFSWQRADLAETYGSLRVFDQLRLDPYYRTTAVRHPDLAHFLNGLVADYGKRAVCLVHGDWSPKNFLVTRSTVMAIDFEAIHFGDPAFDTAFLLHHLVLKSFHQPDRAPALALAAVRFWGALRAEVTYYPDFEEMTLTHLPALLLARMDGKSPAEYIVLPQMEKNIREFARSLLHRRPHTISEVWDRMPI